MNIDSIRRAEAASREASPDNEGLTMADQSQRQQLQVAKVYESLDLVVGNARTIRWAASQLVTATADLIPAWQPDLRRTAPLREPSQSPLVTVSKSDRGAKILIGVRKSAKGYYGTANYEFVPYLANPISPNLRTQEKAPRNFVGFGVDRLPYFGTSLEEAREKTQDITWPIELYDGRKQGDQFFDEEHAHDDIPRTLDAAVEASLGRIRELQATIRLMKEGLVQQEGFNNITIDGLNKGQTHVRHVLREAVSREQVQQAQA